MAEISRARKSSIDAVAWPAVAVAPKAHGGALRTKWAEASFARACAKADLALEGDGAALTVQRAEVFDRIAARGWTGLAEGFMAGEWATPSSEGLVHVLERLIRVGYRPTPARVPAPEGGRLPVGAVGELPPDLVQHFDGGTSTHAQGHFGTGVPTTQRIRMKSHTPGAGRGNEPSHHFVDVTEFGAPLAAQRDDLGDAQRRSVAMLLDAAAAGPGTHLLEMPCSGGAVTAEALRRRCTPDVVTFDSSVGKALAEQLILDGAEGAARIDVLGASSEIEPLSQERHGVYDAIVSMHGFENMPDKEQVAYLVSAERMLAQGGKIAMQTVVRTDAYSRSAAAALASMTGYAWPRMNVVHAEDVARIVDKYTGLRITALTTAPEHLAASLKLQRMAFDARLRDAAADGYDIVFRRMWTWQLALREALARLEMLDLAQVTMVQRHRGGRR